MKSIEVLASPVAQHEPRRLIGTIKVIGALSWSACGVRGGLTYLLHPARPKAKLENSCEKGENSHIDIARQIANLGVANPLADVSLSDIPFGTGEKRCVPGAILSSFSGLNTNSANALSFGVND